MAVNTQIESCWRKLARERWPGRDIFGDGYYAILFCGGTISLTCDDSWARASVNHACFPELRCKRTHTLFDLRQPTPKPKPPAQPIQLHFAESARESRRQEFGK